MSDRRQELLRQQAQLKEQLASLDKELAVKTGDDAPPSSAPLPAGATPQPPAATSPDADALLSRYAANERHDPAALRRGCLVAFAVALGTILLGVAAIYFLRYAAR